MTVSTAWLSTGRASNGQTNILATPSGLIGYLYGGRWIFQIPPVGVTYQSYYINGTVQIRNLGRGFYTATINGDNNGNFRYSPSWAEGTYYDKNGQATDPAAAPVGDPEEYTYASTGQFLSAGTGYPWSPAPDGGLPGPTTTPLTSPPATSPGKAPPGIIAPAPTVPTPPPTTEPLPKLEPGPTPFIPPSPSPAPAPGGGSGGGAGGGAAGGGGTWVSDVETFGTGHPQFDDNSGTLSAQHASGAPSKFPWWLVALAAVLILRK